MVIWSSSPSPASFPEMVTLSLEQATLADTTTCGCPAQTADATRAAVANARARTARILKCRIGYSPFAIFCSLARWFTRKLQAPLVQQVICFSSFRLQSGVKHARNAGLAHSN